MLVPLPGDMLEGVEDDPQVNVACFSGRSV